MSQSSIKAYNGCVENRQGKVGTEYSSWYPQKPRGQKRRTEKQQCSEIAKATQLITTEVIKRIHLRKTYSVGRLCLIHDCLSTFWRLAYHYSKNDPVDRLSITQQHGIMS